MYKWQKIIGPGLIVIFLLAAFACTNKTARITRISAADKAGIVSEEFIFDRAPFASCHASTIAETDGGLIAAWFGGSREKNPDVGIWLARRDAHFLSETRWSEPREVANGVQEDGKRYPSWNPVLFQVPGGPLLLFYKVGPSPKSWWGMLTNSIDGGKTWSKPQRLPDGILGPIKDKPVQMPDKSLLCGSSTEGWNLRVHMEKTADLGKTWTKTSTINDVIEIDAIQPTIMQYPSGKIQILSRTRQGFVAGSWSADQGDNWSAMLPLLLPNPNSGIDGVVLRDGRALLVYNHTISGRSPLNVAVSSDGKNWKAAVVLENDPGEYSYPAVVQTADGLVHVTYTWNRKRIKHVVLDPEKFILRNMPGDRWP